MKTLRSFLLFCMAASASGCSLEGYPAIAAAVASPSGAPVPCKLPAMAGAGFAWTDETALFSGGMLTVDWPAGRVIAGGGMLSDAIATAPVILADPTLRRFILAPGERDLLAGVSAEEVSANYDRLVHVLAGPQRQLILLTLPHLFGPYAGLNAQIDLFNQHLCTLTKPGSVWVVDLAPVMEDPANFTAQSGFLEPSILGNQALVQAYAAVNR